MGFYQTVETLIMSDYLIYHNPRCSKSRQTLQLLRDGGIEPEIRLYLEAPPSAEELTAILTVLGIPARDLLRSGEDEYAQENLSDPTLSESDLIQAMVQHPRLIERPIVIRDQTRAVLGRPPERIAEILD